MIKLKSTLSEYTKADFIELLEQIFAENSAPTDEQLDPLLEHFEAITEHPDGSDLIFYPDTEQEGTPEAIAEKVARWRQEQGLSGFKIEGDI